MDSPTGELPLDLRERLRGFGSDHMSEAELLAIVLGTGIRGANVRRLAEQLLDVVGGVEQMLELEPAELEVLPGLGPARAARLHAAFELGRRAWRPRLGLGQSLQNARDAVAHFHGILHARKREEFHVLLLDTKNRVLGHRAVSVGGLQSSIVHPREVFRTAIRLAAATIVVAHNHPSGDPTPSPEDEAVTNRLRDAGGIVGIELLDHLVIGSRSFYSFAEHKVMDFT